MTKEYRNKLPESKLVLLRAGSHAAMPAKLASSPPSTTAAADRTRGNVPLPRK